MINLHFCAFDEYFEIYHHHIEGSIQLDEYLDWLNTLQADHKQAFLNISFNEGKLNNAFAWHCLEVRGWFLHDFIGSQEPTEFDDY